MNNNLVSVILPVYNAERYIEKSIRSVLDQTYNELELIIIDDGSSDSSKAIIKTFKDNRIRFYAHPHLGLISQLNFGVQNAEGNFIARMDADDMDDKNRLAVQIAYLKNNSDIQLVSTNYNFIDENDKIYSEKTLPEFHEDIEYMMPILNSICHASMVTYKTAVIDAGSYRDKYLFVEDQDLFLRMISCGMKMHNLQEALYSYRIKNKRYSKADRETLLRNRYQIGTEYLNNYYQHPTRENYHFNFRYGLIEYYSGDINSARKYLLNAFKLKHSDKKSLYRYLLPTLLGDSIIKFLREKNILSGISLMMNKLGRDYHKIIKNEQI
jgi:glycosyltransferase involved in cell wall biosynthesis